MSATAQSDKSEPARYAGLFRSPVLDHFSHPRNTGVAAEHNRSYLEEDNPWQVRLRFTLRVEQDRIAEVKFQAQSCVTTTASASALTVMAQGKRVKEALAITPEQLSRELGTVPPEKMYCCQLAVATLQKALRLPELASAASSSGVDTEVNSE